MKTIVAMYASEIDAQKSINLFTSKGLDTDELSAIFSNKGNDEEIDSYESSDDEEDFVDDEPVGLIEPLEGIELNGSTLELGGDGDFIVAGKLSAEHEDSSVGTDSDEILELDAILLDLGIEAADLEAYENRIKAGEVLVTISTEENYEEIREILGDGDPVTLEEIESEE